MRPTTLTAGALSLLATIAQSGCCPGSDCFHGEANWSPMMVFKRSSWDYDEDVPERFLLVEGEIQEEPGELVEIAEVMEIVPFGADWIAGRDHDAGWWLHEPSNQPCSLSVVGTLALVDEQGLPVDESAFPAFDFSFHTSDIGEGPLEPWPATELSFHTGLVEYCHIL